jgi:hypothetical protein
MSKVEFCLGGPTHPPLDPLLEKKIGSVPKVFGDEFVFLSMTYIYLNMEIFNLWILKLVPTRAHTHTHTHTHTHQTKQIVCLILLCYSVCKVYQNASKQIREIQNMKYVTKQNMPRYRATGPRQSEKEQSLFYSNSKLWLIVLIILLNVDYITIIK